MRILGRLIVVPLGLLLAAFAAMAVIVSLGQEQVVRALHSGASDEALFGLAGIVLKLALVFLTPQIFVVPILIAVGGEVARIRALTFYVAAFGAFAALIPLVARIETAATAGIPVWALFATAGFAAGLVYWLVAGRAAGPA